MSEDTLPKINSENEHLQRTISSLTQQLDASDRQLEEERAARQVLEDSRDSKIKEVESSWKAVIEEKKDNWEAKERSLEEKVESQERLLNELKASYEVAQRLGQGGDGENEGRQNAVSAAELEIVSSDLDRTSQRLAEVEARNEQLRVDLAEASSNTQRQATTEEDPNNARLRSENSALLRKLDNIRLEKDTETRKRETRIRALEKDAQMLEHEREGLRERVQSWRDYNEIKQELEIFKVIQINVIYEPLLTTRSPSNSRLSMTTTQIWLPKVMRVTIQLNPMVPVAPARVNHSKSCYSQGTRSWAMRWLCCEFHIETCSNSLNHCKKFSRIPMPISSDRKISMLHWKQTLKKYNKKLPMPSLHQPCPLQAHTHHDIRHRHIMRTLSLIAEAAHHQLHP